MTKSKVTNNTNQHQRWKNWPELDPFENTKFWLEEGLSLGLETASRDRSKLRKNISIKITFETFRIVGFILNLLQTRPDLYISGDINARFQQPWMPAWPGLSRNSFPQFAAPWKKLLEENYLVIRSELNNLLAEQDHHFKRAVFDGFDYKPWTAIYFHLFGKKIDKTHVLCPETSRILEQVPHNSSHTCFSCLPGTGALPPHVGPTNTSLISHLGLINCEDTMIFSGQNSKCFEEGKVLMLDDSFVHGVKNSNSQPRYTLMISCWHPELTTIDKKLLQRFYKLAEKFQQ